MKYKKANTASELQNASDDYIALHNDNPHLNITEWGAINVEPDIDQLGLKGSPTKVKQVQNIVFQVKDSKTITNDDEQIEDLMKELIDNHSLG